MIGRLTGIVAEQDLEGNVIIEVGGVGYEVTVPVGAAASVGEKTTLHIHTHVREDALLLYGFKSSADRRTFRLLVSISNVGPKIALAILSAMSPASLSSAVHGRDTQALTVVPGVGKKTAERIVLELRDKLQVVDETGDSAVEVEQSTGVRVLDALTRMGFRSSEAEKAIAALGDLVRTEPLEAVFREALAVLHRGGTSRS